MLVHEYGYDVSIEDRWNFAKSVRRISKPTIIIANKMDLGPAEKEIAKIEAE